MTPIERIRDLLRLAAEDTISGGRFKEVVTAEDGRQITYDFPLATGMAWNAKKTLYSRQFGNLPNWVFSLHPMHRIRLCDLSCEMGQPLPQAIEKEEMALYFSKGQSELVSSNARKAHGSKNLKEDQKNAGEK